MKKTTVLSIVLPLLFVFFTGLSYAAEKPVKLKFAHLGNPDPFKSAGQAAVLNFKYLMEKGSGGRYQIDIYPAGTLGKEIDLMEAVKNNVVQFFSASMVALHRIFPPALIMMSPYVFRNEAVAWEVIDGAFGQKLLDAFTEKTDVKAFLVFDVGFSTITNSVRPLRKPEDFKGIKFRGMGTLQVNMFNSLGGSAVPISWTEVYTSLQTGVVHGQTNPPSIIYAFKLYEVQKYLSLANSQFMYQLWVCNKQWYDGLSEEDKKLIRDAAKGASQTVRGMSLLLDQKAITELKKVGMTVSALSDSEIVELQKLARPAGLKWLKTQMDPQWVDDFMMAVKEAEKKLGY